MHLSSCSRVGNCFGQAGVKVHMKNDGASVPARFGVSDSKLGVEMP